MGERENSIEVTINGIKIVDASDCDPSVVANVLSVTTEAIRRFGLKHALRVLERSSDLQKAMFVEAQCGSGLVSTMVLK